jgi:hypothetical protein
LEIETSELAEVLPRDRVMRSRGVNFRYEAAEIELAPV